MSKNWKERWEEKNRDGREVVDVATWSDGTPCIYSWRGTGGREAQSVLIGDLIPRKPAPVVVPWELDEVPIGAVVRSKTINSRYGLITQRRDDLFFVEGCRFCSVGDLFDLFVLHRTGVPTEQCPPCGKVVKS